MKIFRFLSDMLSPEEFESLSYYHVSRFISNLLRMAFEESKSRETSTLDKISLRQFICVNLDLKYQQT